MDKLDNYRTSIDEATSNTTDPSRSQSPDKPIPLFFVLIVIGTPPTCKMLSISRRKTIAHISYPIISKNYETLTRESQVEDTLSLASGLILVF